jgi:hypothetical protein
MEFKNQRDIDIAARSTAIGRFWGRRPDLWNVYFRREFDMTLDNHLFANGESLFPYMRENGLAV